MKKIIKIFIFMVLNSNLYAGKYFKITQSPYENLNGKIAKIKGDSKKVWDIEDVWLSNKSFSIYAILNYLMTHPPKEGKVYYGKVIGSVCDLGYCFHESWLQEIDEEIDMHR